MRNCGFDIAGGLISYRLAGRARERFVAASSTKSLGNAKDAVNLKRILEAAGVKKASAANQLHGAEIEVIHDGRCDFKQPANADGLISFAEGPAVVIFTADCLPVILYDEYSGLKGVIHCGWRGLKEKIISGTLSNILSRSKIDAGNIKAILGPCAGACCYKVSRGFWGNFPEEKITATFSLQSYAFKELNSAGLIPQNIYSSNLCTICGGDMFYSYRKDNTQYRSATFIADKRAGIC